MKTCGHKVWDKRKKTHRAQTGFITSLLNYGIEAGWNADAREKYHAQRQNLKPIDNIKISKWPGGNLWLIEWDPITEYSDGTGLMGGAVEYIVLYRLKGKAKWRLWWIAPFNFMIWPGLTTDFKIAGQSLEDNGMYSYSRNEVIIL